MNWPETWVETPMDAVCDINPPLSPDERPAPDTPVSFVPMSAVDETTGKLSKSETRPYAEVAKGYTSFKPKDLLFAKVTPCMENGKAAIAYELQSGLGFGSTEFHILRPSAMIIPEYLLQFIRQPIFRLQAASAFVGTGGLRRVPQSFLARTKVPVPTLPEQQRIVDILQKVESLQNLKKTVGDISQQLTLAVFERFFGVVGSGKRLNYEPFGKHTTYSKYGPRFPDRQYSDEGVHILRTTDMNRNGTIRWQQSPKLELSDAQLAEHGLRPGTVLISRSGTIGPVALYDGPERTCVAGAYLIEFGLAETLDIEFARTLFLTPYFQRMLQKAVRSVAQPNINAPAIKEILIPVPPPNVQSEFARTARELRQWQQIEEQSAGQLEIAANAIRTEAFTGALTESWRELHAGDLALAIETRDVVLHDRDSRVVRIKEHAPPEEAPLQDRSTRNWLLNQLSDFQGFVRTALQEFKGTLLPDDSQALDNFCRLWPIEHEMRPHDRVRRVLDQLAELGLIAKITVHNGLGDFVTGYRSLRPDEETRLQDADRLQMVFRREPTKAQEGTSEKNEAKNDGGESQP